MKQPKAVLRLLMNHAFYFFSVEGLPLGRVGEKPGRKKPKCPCGSWIFFLEREQVNERPSRRFDYSID